MSLQKLSVIIFMCMAGILSLNASPEDYQDLQNTRSMIRQDKFDYVLPRAMRNNNIDMWITIDKGRGTEPLFQDLGDPISNGNGLYIFTDRGGNRIERAILFSLHRQMEGR